MAAPRVGMCALGLFLKAARPDPIKPGESIDPRLRRLALRACDWTHAHARRHMHVRGMSWRTCKRDEQRWIGAPERCFVYCSYSTREKSAMQGLGAIENSTSATATSNTCTRCIHRIAKSINLRDESHQACCHACSCIPLQHSQSLGTEHRQVVRGVGIHRHDEVVSAELARGERWSPRG